MIAVLLLVVAPAANAQVPAGWTATNVGSPWIKGSASASGGTFTVSGSGSDIWGTRDQFMFVYRQLTGDGVITARVASLDRPNDYAKAGVMFRSSLTQSSQNGFMLVSAAAGTAFQTRLSSSGTTTSTAGSSSSAPRWVKVERQGTVFTAFESADGVNWVQVDREVMSAPATMYVGLAVTSHNTGALANATFSNVSVSALTGLPNNWSSGDVGSPAVTGKTTYSSGTFNMTGAGNDVWGSSDQFQFAYTQVTGDVDLVARVKSIQNVDSWSKAGVMIRASLASNAAHGTMFVSAARGTAFQRRRSSGATSLSTSGGSKVAPYWVKISRRGNVLTASQSSDGATWTTVSTDTVTLSSLAYVGLAVTSHKGTAATASVFDNVTVTPLSNSQNQPPSVSITAPTSNAHYPAPATMTVTATASDTDGNVSRVDFYSNSTLIGSSTTSPYSVSWNSVAAGSYSLTAVATDDDGATTTSAPIPIVVDGGNQAPVIAITSPTNGSTFTAPATMAITASASDSDGSVARVDFYAGSSLIGTVTSGAATVTWSNVAAGTYALTAVATDDRGLKTTSAAVSVTVGANRAPTVNITAPTSGASYRTSTSVAVSASASDSDGAVTRVDFYAGSTLIGSDTSSPYSVTWNATTAGTYSLTAVATDDSGSTTRSAAVSVTISQNQSPVVSLTSPAAGANYLAPATIVVSANASDADGGVVSVAFYAGSTLIGTDNTSPYSLTWQNATAGTYPITAVATDTTGAKTTSAAVSVTVAATRTAVFTASPDHQTLSSYLLEVYVAGANPSTATPVATQNLGKPAVTNGDCSADITATIRSLASGSYFATVSAVAADGTKARSTGSPTFLR